MEGQRKPQAYRRALRGEKTTQESNYGSENRCYACGGLGGGARARCEWSEATSTMRPA